MCTSNIIAPQKYRILQKQQEEYSTGHLITFIKVSLFHNSETKVNSTKQRDKKSETEFVHAENM